MIPNPHPGCFIVFEGIDRCGKLTQLHKIRGWLEDRNYQVCFYSEPNDQSSLIGQRIRQILKHGIGPPAPLEFQRMFVIDRAQSIICFLRPALETGCIELVERYAHSTIAFGMLDRPAEDLIELHRQVIGPNMIWPDLTFIFNISPEEALRRMAKNRDVPQYFEKKDKLERVRKNYLEISRRDDMGEMVVINAERSPEAIFNEILPIALAVIKSKLGSVL